MKNTLKNLSLAFVAIILFSFSNSYAQQKKYEAKDGIFYMDGKAQFTFDELNNATTKKKDIILKNTKGERLILFQLKETSTKTTYYEVHFLNNNSKTEINSTDLSGLGQTIIESQLITEGVLNVEAEKKFVAANEGKFTKPKTK